MCYHLDPIARGSYTKETRLPEEASQGTRNPRRAFLDGRLRLPLAGFTREEVALLSPYQTRHIKRFGNSMIAWESLPRLVEEDLPLLE
jgi:hypothetical protein